MYTVYKKKEAVVGRGGEHGAIKETRACEWECVVSKRICLI